MTDEHDTDPNLAPDVDLDPDVDLAPPDLDAPLDEPADGRPDPDDLPLASRLARMEYLATRINNDQATQAEIQEFLALREATKDDFDEFAEALIDALAPGLDALRGAMQEFVEAFGGEDE